MLDVSGIKNSPSSCVGDVASDVDSWQRRIDCQLDLHQSNLDQLFSALQDLRAVLQSNSSLSLDRVVPTVLRESTLPFDSVKQLSQVPICDRSSATAPTVQPSVDSGVHRNSSNVAVEHRVIASGCPSPAISINNPTVTPSVLETREPNVNDSSRVAIATTSMLP